jgi:hypothetical protein
MEVTMQHLGRCGFRDHALSVLGSLLRKPRTDPHIPADLGDPNAGPGRSGPEKLEDCPASGPGLVWLGMSAPGETRPKEATDVIEQAAAQHALFFAIQEGKS